MRTDLTALLIAGLITGCAGPRPSLSSIRADVLDRTQVELSTGRVQVPKDSVRGPITIEDAVRLALERNRELHATFEELGLTQAELTGARWSNPTVDAELGFDPGHATKVELTIVQSLTTLLHTYRRRRVAEAQLEAERKRIAGQVLDLIFDVRRAFYEVQAAQERLAITQDNLAAAAARFEMARRIRHAGNTPQLAVDTEQAMYERARLDLSRAEVGVSDAREHLNTLMGLWGADIGWEVASALAAPADGAIGDDIESRAIERSLDLGYLEHQMEAASEAVGLARGRGWLPNVELGLKSERETDDFVSGPVLEITLPLFDQNQRETERAFAELRAARERHTTTAVAIRARVRKLKMRTLAASDRARHYRGVVVPLSKKIVHEAQLQFNAMQIGTFQLVATRQQLVDARLGAVDANVEYWRNRARLDQALAGRISALDDSSPGPRPMTTGASIDAGH